jgi:hypothetical protein
VALAVILAPLVSHAAPATEADKKAARPHYEKGAVEYNLGHFAEAIVEFEKAYELDRAPILLFNIAQAHRQNGNIERAAFFYRRYLEQAPDAANRPEVEKRIKDLDEAMRQQNDLKRRPPTEVANDDQTPSRVAQQVDAATPPPPTTPPPVSPTAGPSSGAAGGTGLVSTVKQPPPPPPVDHHIRLALSAGPAFPKFSGRDLDQATLLAIRAGGVYTFTDLLPTPKVRVDVGGALQYSPLEYRTIDTGAHQTAGFWGLLVTGDIRYRVAPALDLDAELGAGFTWWSGLHDMNPFTAGGAGASGPVAMPSALIGVGATYEVGYNVFVFAQPTFLFSKTTGDGFSSAVSSVLRFDLALGIGYSI